MSKAVNLFYQPVRATLSDLLSSWAQLEPERCGYEHAAYHVNIDAHWHTLCGSDNTLCAAQQGLLQMALQNALAERDFSWTLSVHDGLCAATVRAAPCLEVADSTLTEITTYSEAMSLLWAYLAALSPSSNGLDA